MITLPLALALAFAPAATPPCADLPPSSTIADQFACYKEAGRKVTFAGSGFVDGFDGPGCVVGVWADRLQVSNCSRSSFDRKTVMVLYSSIRSIQDDPDAEFVTIRLTPQYSQVDCARVACTDPNTVVVATPAPVYYSAPPAGRPHRFALPRKP